MIKCDFCGKIIPQSYQGVLALSKESKGYKTEDALAEDYIPIDCCLDCCNKVSKFFSKLKNIN